jgi:hypothetical protein
VYISWNIVWLDLFFALLLTNTKKDTCNVLQAAETSSETVEESHDGLFCTQCMQLVLKIAVLGF